MQARVTLLTKMGGFPSGITCHAMDWLFYFISYNGFVAILCIFCVSYFVPLYNALANNIDPGFESKLHIKLCLLLWFKFFKTMILLLAGLRDFSVRFREIILESNRIQSANCHWWHFFPTVAYFGNQRQTNRGWVSKFQEYANCFD